MTEIEYKERLKDKLITYRANLHLPKDVTFGIEIEYENVVNDYLSYVLSVESNFNNKLVGWNNVRELDIVEYNEIGEEMNGEINSSILTDSLKTWKSLREMLDLLKKNNAIVTEKCGAHINIGAHILECKTNYFRNFLLLWLLYEKEIYKFSSGENLCVRTRKDNIINNASKILKINNICKHNDNIFEYLNNVSKELYSKCYDFSFNDVHTSYCEKDNKIEFRVPNATLNEEIYQNYINFFAKFLLACKKELDIEKTVYKIKNNLHNVVELADYVFDEQIDKDNFLIQALKTNEIYKKELQPHKTYKKQVSNTDYLW